MTINPLEKIIVGELKEYKSDKHNYAVSLGGRIYFSQTIPESAGRGCELVNMSIMREQATHGVCFISDFGKHQRNGRVNDDGTGERIVVIDPITGKLRPIVKYDNGVTMLPGEWTSYQAKFKGDLVIRLVWTQDSFSYNNKERFEKFKDRIPGLEEFLTPVKPGHSFLDVYVGKESFQEMQDPNEYLKKRLVQVHPELFEIFGDKIYDKGIRVTSAEWNEVEFIEWLESRSAPEEVPTQAGVSELYSIYYNDIRMINIPKEDIPCMLAWIKEKDIILDNDYLVIEEVLQYPDGDQLPKITVVKLPVRHKEILRKMTGRISEAN